MSNDLEEIKDIFSRICRIYGDKYNFLLVVQEPNTNTGYQMGVGCLRCIVEGLHSIIDERGIQHEDAQSNIVH